MKQKRTSNNTDFILFPIRHIIEIVGNVASGKTTTSRHIARVSSFAYVDCDVFTKNPFLTRSVKEPRRWALPNDIHFSYERSKKIPLIIKKMEEEPLVLDSGFDMGIYVYSKNSYLQKDLTEDEWELLLNIHKRLITHIPPIYATIFLDVPAKTIMERIWQRGREHEQHYSLKYVENLQERIEEYKNDMIALKQRKVIATYNQLEKQLTFHTKEDTKLSKLFSLLEQ